MRHEADLADSGALKHASPKGIYIAPVPDRTQLWTGVMYIRKGKLL